MNERHAALLRRFRRVWRELAQDPDLETRFAANAPTAEDLGRLWERLEAAREEEEDGPPLRPNKPT